MKKRIFALIYCLLVSNAYCFTILVDPGHGGEDQGAQGYYIKSWKVGKKYKKKRVYVLEKDLTLKLAKKVHQLIAKKYTAYLTRSIDRTVHLSERANLADKIKADLFISIHFNSNRKKTSNGYEIYYLDNHKDVAVKKVETVENETVEGQDNIINQILIDLVIKKTVKTSKELAKRIHQKVTPVTKKYRVRNRGVKPGLFYVLALSKRPGVLVEAGFISNPNELKKMMTGKYLDSMAKAIADGVDAYAVKFKQEKSIPLF